MSRRCGIDRSEAISLFFSLFRSLCIDLLVGLCCRLFSLRFLARSFARSLDRPLALFCSFPSLFLFMVVFVLLWCTIVVCNALCRCINLTMFCLFGRSFFPFSSKMFIWYIASKKKSKWRKETEKKTARNGCCFIFFGSYLSLSWKYRTKRTN